MSKLRRFDDRVLASPQACVVSLKLVILRVLLLVRFSVTQTPPTMLVPLRSAPHRFSSLRVASLCFVLPRRVTVTISSYKRK